jgi:hypothetical protein
VEGKRKALGARRMAHGGRQMLDDDRYKRSRWPRASSQIEKETLKKRITNIEQGISNIEVRYSIIIIF